MEAVSLQLGGSDGFDFAEDPVDFAFERDSFFEECGFDSAFRPRPFVGRRFKFGPVSAEDFGFNSAVDSP